MSCYQSTLRVYMSVYISLYCLVYAIGSSTMDIYGFVGVVLLAAGTWCCSIPPNLRYYSLTDRVVLAPFVIHGRVLNISASSRRNTVYKACVDVVEVIKGDKAFPKQICFGEFGGDYLCLNQVYEGVEYIFFMNSDRTAQYQGLTATVVANDRTISLTKAGYCKPIQPQSKPCEPPTINKKNFQSYVKVKEGERAVLSCYASGTAPLLYVWTKKGVQDHETKFIQNTLSRYQIDVASLSDSGVYTCTVSNPAGKTKVAVRLYIEPVQCGGFLALQPGKQLEIQSPNYPRHYFKDKECSWRICPAPGQRVKLDFKYFDMKRSSEDYLQIYNECDPDWNNGLLKYCMASNPGTLVSKCTSRCVNVWFRSNNQKGYLRARGFHAIVSSTDEATSLFDYKQFYCSTDILLRFIPKEVYFSSTSGRVLDNYKSKGPRPGQNIRIRIRSSAKSLFGCYADFRANKEYYIGLTVSPLDGSYRLRFVMLTDADNKPQQFDQQLNKFKTTKLDCSPPPNTLPPFPTLPTHPPRTNPPRTDPPRTNPPRTNPPRTNSPRTNPPRTDPPRTDPPRTNPPRTDTPRTNPPRTNPPRTDTPPPPIPTEIPEGPRMRPSPTGTSNPLDP